MAAPPKRVLIIERSRDVALLIQSVLQEEGYDALWRPRSSDAVAQIRRCCPDLLILDLAHADPDRPLDRADSLLLDALCADPDTSEIPLVLLAPGDRPIHVAPGGCAPRTVLPKPFEVDDLAAQVRRSLEEV